MFIQLGLTCFFICAINLIFMVREVVHYTPNWKDTDVDADEISVTFLPMRHPKASNSLDKYQTPTKRFL
jgi:hypothetical protein